jgi:hypothetical protein
VDEAAALGLNIVFSGGEPMMRPDLVYELADRVRDSGVSLAIYTNAFWARSLDKALAIVDKLRKAGIDTLLTSTDVFHVEFVPAECVDHACRAASARGMRVEVAVPARARDREAESLAERLRAIPGLTVKTHGIARVGRASELKPNAFSFSAHDRPCSVLGQLALMPDGNIYGCCAASIHFGPDSPLTAGRFPDHSLKALVRRLRTRVLLDDIQEQGPLRAALSEAIRHPGFSMKIRHSYSDICATCSDLCAAVSGPGSLQDSARDKPSARRVREVVT